GRAEGRWLLWRSRKKSRTQRRQAQRQDVQGNPSLCHVHVPCSRPRQRQVKSITGPWPKTTTQVENSGGQLLHVYGLRASQSQARKRFSLLAKARRDNIQRELPDQCAAGDLSRGERGRHACSCCHAGLAGFSCRFGIDVGWL